MNLDELIEHLEALREELGHGRVWVENEKGRLFSKDDITLVDVGDGLVAQVSAT